MYRDYIEDAKKEIVSTLNDKYKEAKFTVIFNGEFFVVNSDKPMKEEIGEVSFSFAVNEKINGNKAIFYITREWLQDCIKKIDQIEHKDNSVSIGSQIMRLEKQIEFELYGGSWNDELYSFVKDILYMLHTKSKSIRENIVNRCAKEYNKLQRNGAIPKEIILGYKNALSQISYLGGEENAN